MAKITELSTEDQSFSVRKDVDGDFVVSIADSGDEFYLFKEEGLDTFIELLEQAKDIL